MTAWLEALRAVAAPFLVTRVLVFAAALASPLFLQERGLDIYGMHAREFTGLPYPLDTLLRWDAVHYLTIALEGYTVGVGPWDTNVPFLPLYPLLMRLLGVWAGPAGLVATGMVLSNSAFLGALALLYRLARLDFDDPTARRAAWYVAVFPTSFFFSALYTESLFLLLTLGIFWCMRHSDWRAAALIGALAAATRLPGALLFVPFLYAWTKQPERTGSEWRLASIIPLGTLAYMTILFVSIGDPLFFRYTFANWSTGPASATPASPGLPVPGFGVLFPAAWAVIFIAAGKAGRRILRPDYQVWFWLYFLVVLGLSFSTQAPFYSFIRFILVLFPAFLVFAQWGRRRWFDLTYVAVSLLFLALSTTLFSRWYWVA